MNATTRHLDEFGIIERFFAPLARGEPGAFGLTDDAAVLSAQPGRQIVVTSDTLIASVHFLADDPADSVAAKVLAVNLSDLAAMGARPSAYTLALALPEAWAEDVAERWLGEFSRGLAAEQARTGVHLVGGDLVATPGETCLTVTALGTVADGLALRRSGAVPGDLVYVSGTIGDAALGLKVLCGVLGDADTEDRQFLIDRYRKPTARIGLGERLHGVAHGVADVSDGLIADLGHICRCSGIAATVDAARVPLSAATAAALARDATLISSVLAGGDDYELVFTAPASASEAIAALSRQLDLPITAIGHLEQQRTANGRPRVHVVDNGKAFATPEEGGYRHFRSAR